MKKKLLSLVLAICLIVPCAFTLTSCGEPPAEEPFTESDFYELLSKDTFGIGLCTWSECVEWIDGYSVQEFDLTYENGIVEKEMIYYSPEYHRSHYTYIKEIVEGATVYKQWDFIYDDTEIITAEVYNNVIGLYSNLINKIKDNFELFAYNSERCEYELNAEGTEIAAAIDAILDDLYIANKAYYILVRRNVVNFYVQEPARDEYGNIREDGIFYYSPSTCISNYYQKKTFGTDIANCVIKGGTGADYGEYYFEENAFRIYTPNIQDATRKDGYFFYDKVADKYYQYRKNESGVWSRSEMQADAYDNGYSQIYDLFFANALSGSNDYYSRTNNNNMIYLNVDGISTTVGGMKYTYKNLKIQLENEAIVSATWDLEITMHGTTFKYSYTLEAGGVDLQFPNV